MNKYANTLKMMGVSGKDALFFSDALETYHLTISPSVKKANRDVLLNTVIMGKTVRDWFIKFDKEAPKPPFWEPQPKPITEYIDDIQAYQYKVLIEVLLQKFYKENLVESK